jgi:hypothetical protein
MTKGIKTIEDLAARIQRPMVSKEDINALEEKLTTRLDSIDVRPDRIGNLLLAEQKREIADLQKRMKRLEDAVCRSPLSAAGA